MDARTRMNKGVPKGYPGCIWYHKMRYGFEKQRYDVKRTILHNWYSDLRAYLPMLYHVRDNDEEKYQKQKEEYKKEVLPKLTDIATELQEARIKYDPVFEMESYTRLEITYDELLDGILERLDELTAYAKILDDVQADDNTQMVV